MPSKVSVAQVEYVRDNSYEPDPAICPGVPIVQDSPGAFSIFPSKSSHATAVAQILTSGYAYGLISELHVCEAVTFCGRGHLNGGRTLPPALATFEVLNCSFGMSDPLNNADIIQKLDTMIARDNVVAFVGPENYGQDGTNGYNGIPFWSKNAVHVGSTLTGMTLPNNPTIASNSGTNLTVNTQCDFLVPVQYVSYCIPTAAAVAIAMISMAKDAGYAWTWLEIKSLMISSCDVVGGNRVLNGPAAIRAMQARVNPAPIVPAPQPTPTPVPAPVPAPQPTRDDLLAQCASQVGATYDASTQHFNAVATNQVAPLLFALQQKSLV